MSSKSSLFDLSELAVASISVTSVDSIEFEHLTDGHAMTELAGSSGCGRCQPSSTTFAAEDDLI